MTKTPPHHHKNTTTPHKHHHKNTTPKTPPQGTPQKHHHTTTKTPPQKHHHKNTTTKTPPQKHHHQNTTTKTQKHHHTTTKTPPQKHKSTTTPTQKHHHKNTTQPHHHKNITTRTPPQKHHRTTTKTPPTTPRELERKQAQSPQSKKKKKCPPKKEKNSQNKSAPFFLGCNWIWVEVILTIVLPAENGVHIWKASHFPIRWQHTQFEMVTLWRVSPADRQRHRKRLDSWAGGWLVKNMNKIARVMHSCVKALAPRSARFVPLLSCDSSCCLQGLNESCIGRFAFVHSMWCDTWKQRRRVRMRSTSCKRMLLGQMEPGILSTNPVSESGNVVAAAFLMFWSDVDVMDQHHLFPGKRLNFWVEVILIRKYTKITYMQGFLFSHTVAPSSFFFCLVPNGDVVRNSKRRWSTSLNFMAAVQNFHEEPLNLSVGIYGKLM